jgi:hypothetical protein
MRDHEKSPEEIDRVEDLDVPEPEADEVKGGISFNYSKMEMEYKAPPSPSKLN